MTYLCTQTHCDDGDGDGDGDGNQDGDGDGAVILLSTARSYNGFAIVFSIIILSNTSAEQALGISNLLYLIHGDGHGDGKW